MTRRPGELAPLVGVVPDILSAGESEGAPAAYFSLAQVAPTTLTVTLRMRERSRPPLPALREAVRGVDPTLALYAGEWLGEAISRSRRCAG